MVTDGPFQEFKEWLAGYQIMDVESEARAIEIAGRISAVPGPNGIPTAAADPGAAADGVVAVDDHRDVRVPGDGGRDALTPTSAIEDLLRELAPRVLGAVVRRLRRLRCRRGRRPGGAGRRRDRWPKDGVPEQPMAWLVRAASRRMIDQWRSDESRRRARAAVAPPRPRRQMVPERDDTLPCSSSAATRR